MSAVLFISHGTSLKDAGFLYPFQESVREVLNSVIDLRLVEYADLANKNSIFKSLVSLENKGASRVLIIPVFIHPSIHVNFDIPILSGIRIDNERMPRLISDGYPIYKGRLRSILAPSILESGILLNELSDVIEINKCNSLHILCHGSKLFEYQINNQLGKIRDRLEQKGVKLVVHFEGIGRKISENFYAELGKSLKQKGDVCVYGAYVYGGADELIKSGNNVDSFIKKFGWDVFSRIHANEQGPGLSNYYMDWIQQLVGDYVQ